MRFGRFEWILVAVITLLIIVLTYLDERDVYAASFEGDVSITSEFRSSDPRTFLLLFGQQRYSSIKITIHGEPSITDNEGERIISYSCSGVIRQDADSDEVTIKVKEVQLIFSQDASERHIYWLSGALYRSVMVSASVSL